MKHGDIIQAMMKSGVSNKEAWVIARELAGSQLLLEVPATDRSVKIAMEKGGVQGGVMTPDDWNDLIEDCLETLVEEWDQEGVGFRCGHAGRLSHLVWADNIWLFAKSRE